MTHGAASAATTGDLLFTPSLLIPLTLGADRASTWMVNCWCAYVLAAAGRSVAMRSAAREMLYLGVKGGGEGLQEGGVL